MQMKVTAGPVRNLNGDLFIFRKDEFGQYLSLGYWGTFYKRDSGAEDDRAFTKLSKATNFSEDRALIRGEDSSGKSYAAMIDTNGKIIYKKEGAYVLQNFLTLSEYEFSGVACFTIHPDVYQIVNKNGKVIATSEDGEFDKVIAYGDGLSLVFKDNSDVNGSHYCFGIIDQNGNWKQPLQEWDYYPNFYDRYAAMIWCIFQTIKSYTSHPSTEVFRLWM